VNPTEERLDKELKEFQLKLEGILKEFLEQGSIEVYSNLRIVVTSFDRIDRMAFLKGNIIYVNVKARTYPEFVLSSKKSETEENASLQNRRAEGGRGDVAVATKSVGSSDQVAAD
jgi:hypothetical protein